jgi:hypothetical protein
MTSEQMLRCRRDRHWVRLFQLCWFEVEMKIAAKVVYLAQCHQCTNPPRPSHSQASLQSPASSRSVSLWQIKQCPPWHEKQQQGQEVQDNKNLPEKRVTSKGVSWRCLELSLSASPCDPLTIAPTIASDDIPSMLGIQQIWKKVAYSMT